MKIQRKELYNVLAGLELAKNIRGVELAYAVGKNLRKVKAEISVLEGTIEYLDNYKEFEKERIELAKEHSNKNEDGTPIKKIGANQKEQFDIIDMVYFEEQLEFLKDRHKEAMTQREDQEKEFEKTYRRRS